jgi:peptidoglycan/LPS O-acetylase OafA/YrhL
MYPFALAAGAVTLYFLVVAFQRPRPAAILAVILWAAYSVYEYYVANGTLCDANCNIRVDLILAWPLLAFATWYACNTPGQRSIVNKVLGVIALVIIVLLVAPLAYIALVGFPATTQSGPSSTPSPK